MSHVHIAFPDVLVSSPHNNIKTWDKIVGDCHANMAEPLNLKIVLVGPPGGGKSSMILSLTTNTFKDFHSPTEFENCTAKVEVDSQQSFLLR